jgi:hypothetical protein
MSRAFWEGFLDGMTAWAKWPVWALSARASPSQRRAKSPATEPMKLRTFEDDLAALRQDGERVMQDLARASQREADPARQEQKR